MEEGEGGSGVEGKGTAALRGVEWGLLGEGEKKPRESGVSGLFV